MNCGNCGYANSPSAKFCRNCGRLLSRGAPATPRPSPSEADLRCASCGARLREGARFCASCGARIGQVIPVDRGPIIESHASAPQAMGSGTVTAAARPAEEQFDSRSLPSWVAEAKRLGWRKLWPLALLVVYVLWTKNIWVIAVGFGIAWVIRKYSDKIDQTLRPIWPHRDRIPRRTRKILAWVVPVIVTLLITLNPPIWPMLGWLPIVGPQGSLTIFTAFFAAFTAYVFVREPKRVAAR